MDINPWYGDKPPRQYAMEIMALDTREERLEALSKVPEVYREWVKEYVIEWKTWRKKRR